MVRVITRFLNRLQPHIHLILILGLAFYIASLVMGSQIDNYTNTGEDARFNALFNDVKFLEAHMSRIDDFLTIINYHLDYIDLRQSKDSETYKAYNSTCQRLLNKIKTEKNPVMVAFAKAANTSENISVVSDEQKKPLKTGVFWVMLFLFVVTTVTLLLQFNQNVVPPKKEVHQQMRIWIRKTPKPLRKKKHISTKTKEDLALSQNQVVFEE